MAKLNDIPDELLLKILMEVDIETTGYGVVNRLSTMSFEMSVSGSGGSAVHDGIGKTIIADIGRLERRFTRLGRQRGSWATWK
jgi:hypothetical protein